MTLYICFMEMTLEYFEVGCATVNGDFQITIIKTENLGTQ